MTMTFHSLRLAAVLTLICSPWAWGAPHIDLGVSLDPIERRLSATAFITTDSKTLAFYLARGFVLESAEVDGATVPTERSIIDGLQRFQIGLHSETSDQVLKLRYHGQLLPLDISMTHDDTLTALPAMASAQGSYLPGNSGWHPMLESEFTYRVAVTVPAGQIPVAPGAVSEESTAEGIHHAVFSLKHPIDGIDLMVGPWKIHEREVLVGEASIRLRTYFHADSEELAESYLDAAQFFIKRYSAEIGPYPFSEFSVVSSPIPTGFGMPTLTYLGKGVLHFPFIRDISLGHEVLHNWWGNGVRVDPVRGNWAEGLTTFMADYAYREDEGTAPAAQMRHGWLRDYAALPVDSEQPLSAFRARHRAASAAIGYGKAAMMFHALRAKLGDDAFQKGIRNFWDKYKFRSASFDNLREAFEEAGEQPLPGFFDQWLERTGAPMLDVAGARMTMEDNESALEIEISQGTEPYSLLIPLRVFGKEEEQDFHVELSQAVQSFHLPAQNSATVVQVDPGFEVWRKLVPVEAPPILRDLIAADQVLVTTIDLAPDNSVLALAHEFSEGKAKEIDADSEFDPDTPVLIVGSKTGCTAFLERLSLSPRPEQLPAGSVEVWIVPDPSRKIVMVAMEPETDTNRDMSQLGRRLRHFGRYSWVSFAKDGTAARGNWAVNTPRITIPK
jgi:aminopeptidase N